MAGLMLTRDSIFPGHMSVVPETARDFFLKAFSFSSFIFFSSMASESYKLDGEGRGVCINLNS